MMQELELTLTQHSSEKELGHNTPMDLADSGQKNVQSSQKEDI